MVRVLERPIVAAVPEREAREAESGAAVLRPARREDPSLDRARGCTTDRAGHGQLGAGQARKPAIAEDAIRPPRRSPDSADQACPELGQVGTQEGVWHRL